MPYITPEKRIKIDPFIKSLFDVLDLKGEITYVITKIAHLWVLKYYGCISYYTLSEGKSVLVDALDEYKRAVMDKYENKKRKENGPISELDELSLEDVR